MFEIHSVFLWNFHLLLGNFVKSPGMNFFSGEGLTPEAPWTRSIIYIGICICLIMSLKGIGHSFIWVQIIFSELNNILGAVQIIFSEDFLTESKNFWRSVPLKGLRTWLPSPGKMQIPWNVFISGRFSVQGKRAELNRTIINRLNCVL